MSKEVNALILIGHSHLIAQEAPNFLREDIQQGLWYMRHGGEADEYGDQLSEQHTHSLFAGEVFFELGHLANSRYRVEPLGALPPNPLRDKVLDVLDEISPFEIGDGLSEEFALPLDTITTKTSDLPNIYSSLLSTHPELEEELRNKWRKAQAVHARRGSVAVMGYEMEAVFESLRGLNMQEIAPDAVTFDDDLNVAAATYNLHGLVDRSGLRPQLVEFPYYQTLGSVENNEPEMLAAALEDLRTVSQEIGN